ncbi:unnamed protein product [Paramecium octaurelia]|uniref:Uncharacterized protein n=1 Tax=Paramecium octaurelia TaxID=43137 RepID=A0A8S1UVG6_PAROT|nr:unnamed protein product [Paramecium octaurelia]
MFINQCCLVILSLSLLTILFSKWSWCQFKNSGARILSLYENKSIWIWKIQILGYPSPTFSFLIGVELTFRILNQFDA